MATEFGVNILFKAQTQALDKVGQQLGSTERVAQKLNGTLRDSKGRFIAAGDGAGRAANDIKNFGGAADRAAKSAKALQGSVGALLGALGASLAIGKAISDFRELDTSIRRLATAGGDVKGLDAGLRKLSDQLGGVYSKAELAKAAYQSLSAGFSDTADAMKIVGAASKAAYGGLADQEEVTSVLVKTLNAYGLSASKASQITDIISKSIEVGNVEWSDYTSQLGKVSGMAAVAGVSFQDLNAFIAASTKNGATAEQAFTGLSGLLTGLLQPTKESADAAAALGIDWSLAGLKAKGLSGLLGELSKAQEKDAETAARMVGNTEAMRGTFAAAANGGKTYTDVLNTLGGAAGKTDQDFVTMSASIDAKLRGLSTAFKNAGEAFVKAFGPAIQFVISKLTELFGWMEQVFGRMNDLMNNGGRNTQAALQSRPAAVRELRQKYGLFAEWTHGDKLPALEQKHRDAWLKANPAAAAAMPAAPKPGGAIPTLMPGTVSGIDPAIQAAADADKKKSASQQKLADEQEKIDKELAQNRIDIDKELAQNRIDLDNQVFKNQQELIKQRYDLEAELAEKMAGIWANGFQGAARDQANAINQLIKSGEEFGKRVNDLKMQIEAQKQAIKSAEAGIGVAALGGTGGSASGGAALGSGAYPMTSARGPRWGRMHHGVDYAAPVGTPLSTTVGGQVTGSGNDAGGYGRWVEVKLANGVKAFWAHLSEVVLKTGQQFNAGQIIAKTGNTGRSTGPHLHSGDNTISNAGDAFTRLGGKVLGGGAGGTGASGAVVSAQGNAATAKEELAGLQQQLQQLLATEQQFKALDMAAFIQQSTDAFKGQTDTLVKQTETLKLRSALEAEGVDPALIEAEVQKLQVSQQLQERQEALKAAMEAGIITNQAYADSMNAITTAAQGTAGAIDANAQAVVQQRDAANARQQAESDARGIASSITGGMKDAIKAAITGGDVKAALANMLSGIGDRLLDIAMRPLEDMLTKSLTNLFNPQTAATTANTIALEKLNFTLLQTAAMGASGGGFGGIGGIAGAVFGIAGSAFGGGAFGAGFNPLSTTKLFPTGIFAEGGFVTGPTNALIGEGNDSEYVIPASKMPEAMNRYAGGARGKAVIPSGEGPGSAGAVPSLSMSFQTTRFMDRDWVDREQLEAAMAQATKAGAQRGQQRTLDKLRQSPSTRRRLGM